ncbi:MAG: response regulator transcription factor [Candidatus Eremiobacteraeota bacterium]|nr:response regulator transcription factor [Candidatus Eremiobacteraeota bacterium]
MDVAVDTRLSVSDAFMLVLRATPTELRREVAGRRDGTAVALLRAMLAQADGDVASAIRILKSAFVRAAKDDRPYVADLLVPLLVARGELEHIEEYETSSLVPVLAPGAEALCAVVAACRGEPERSREHALLADAASDAVDDVTMRARVQGRLALAAFYRGEYALAERLAQESAALAEHGGAPRFAGTAYSLGYAIAHDVTGDLDAAARYAEALVAAAEACGDGSMRAFGLVGLYELAAERADHEEAQRLQRILRARMMAPQYRERFASVVADALPLAWRGDFGGFRAIVTVLRDTAERSAGERGLCEAFGALAALGLDANDETRRLARRALAVARPQPGISSFEARYRRLARALGAAACVLVGDGVRAKRVADVRFLREDPDIAALVAFAEHGHWEEAPLRVRGYARLVVTVRDALLHAARRGVLTGAELTVLRELASGKNAPMIARESGRSVHTIRTHTSAIVSKLGAHGRGDALARARKLGLIET